MTAINIKIKSSLNSIASSNSWPKNHLKLTFSIIFITLLISTLLILLKVNINKGTQLPNQIFSIAQLTDTGRNNEESASALENSSTAFENSTTSTISSVSTTTASSSSSHEEQSNSDNHDQSTSTTAQTTQTTTIINPSSCPQSTQNCVPCTCSNPAVQYCRCEEGTNTGYKGWACQNNNPGNVKYSSYRIGIITSMGGAAPCGSKGGFMVFSTYDIGRNSVKAYIRGINAGKHSAYSTCGNCSLLTFFTSYAPQPDGSPSYSYSQSIANKMGGGVTQDTLLSWVVENRLDDFINAIQQTEGFFTQ